MKGKMNAKMGNIIIDRDVLGVNVYVVDNRIKVELHIIVAYGVSIRAVAQNVLEHVRYKIETFTGMEVEQINVIVEGVRIVDED